MSRYIPITGLMMGLVSLLSTSCSSEDAPISSLEQTSAVFHLGIDKVSRAAQPLDMSAYDVKMYLYEGRTDDGSLGYTYINRDFEIVDGRVEVTDLSPKTSYKAVFIAVPKGQTPGLPMFGDITPSYEDAVADYIYGNDDETDKEIFRSIISFTALMSTVNQSTVLTRQNGALEIRIKNIKDMSSVELHVNGHTKMYLNDGTGGQVITAGETVPLSKTVTEGLTNSEVRVRINLLPNEDISDATGTNNYLIINTHTGESKKYNLKSDQPTIPIYPNQVTWLTLGNGSGDFKVSFSGNINVEDEEWDGWNN